MKRCEPLAGSLIDVPFANMNQMVNKYEKGLPKFDIAILHA